MPTYQNSITERLQNRKPHVEHKFQIWFRKAIHPLLMLLPGLKIKYQLNCFNDFEPLPNHPIIFAANHSALPDGPFALKAIKRHCYFLAGTQDLVAGDMLFFELNGTIWVDRKDKTNHPAVKNVLIEDLKKGCTILWFPEGTWNLSENLPMLPIKWGIIDVARAANAQIIPMAMDYEHDRKICNVKFGKPLFPSESNAESINALRDALASLRWEFWEQHPDWEVSRQTLDVEQCRREITRPATEYPLFQWDYEQSIIYHPQTAPDEAFAFMDKLIPSKANAFLFRYRQTERTHDLWKKS